MTTELEDGAGRAPTLPDYAMVGPYRLLQQLGEGGMGVVHLALDRNGRAVAIKVLRPHIAHDPDARARLSREVETLGRIEDPRVASVIDADIEGDQPFIVTRYVPGPTLDDVVEERGPLPREHLHRLGNGLAEALHVIHDAGVIHRDLKPGNVLLLDGDPILIDFGIAHVGDDVRLTMAGMVMGTPGYLSPEIVEGAPVSEATDWWGWAATLAYAASGTPPFGTGPMEAVIARVARGEADLSRVDPALAPLLSAALSPEPEERPGSHVVVGALERYAVGRPVTEVLPLAPAPAGGMLPEATRAISTSDTDELPPAPEPEPGDPDGETAPPPTPDDRAIATAGDDAGRPEERPWPGTAPDDRDGDPRIGRPRRSATLVVLLAVAVAGAAVAPVVTVVTAFLWSVLARSTDRSMTSLVMRRHEYGRRRSDVPLAVVAGPWHGLAGLVSATLAFVLPVVMGASAAFCTALVMSGVSGDGSRPGTAIPFAVGMLLGTLMAWWGPGGASLRRGSRSLVRMVTPSDTAAQVVTVCVVFVVIVLAYWAYTHADTALWWPLTSAPSPFDQGGIRLP